MNQKKKGSTYLAAAHQAEPISPATTVQPDIPFRWIGRRPPRADKQLGGVLGIDRSTAGESTTWMKTAALRCL
jgi:hypothetical protein